MFTPFATGIDTTLNKFVHFGGQFGGVVFLEKSSNLSIPFGFTVSDVVNPQVVDLKP
jgi:hypothetical protein